MKLVVVSRHISVIFRAPVSLATVREVTIRMWVYYQFSNVLSV